ncbi:MAG TPA: hypothetical protein VFE38_08110 [Edaphobacter sp.]|nr:hypothetical protein [Edaphobacter sp.]
MRWLLLWMTIALSGAVIAQTPEALPDAPDAASLQQQQVVVLAEAAERANGAKPARCSMINAIRPIQFDNRKGKRPLVVCRELIDPYQRFLDTNIVFPLTPQQKGYLAIHNLTTPGNLLTVAAISAFTVGTDSHSAYGPGLKGFAKNTGVSLLQGATGEFFGTFLIPSIAHQDPRYYRTPHGTPVKRRFFYAVSRTFVANHDDGSLMPNYATLLTYPINAELSNFYVPGIHSDASSTMARIAIGLGTDPVNNLITEFLPDVARHVNTRVIFVQRILNRIATSQPDAF